MSDRVTNAEVEDVLSSIRRLVSEKKQSAQPGRGAVSAAQPVDEATMRPSSERLVLTPALRVSEPHPDRVNQTAAIQTTKPESSGVAIDSLVLDDAHLEAFAEPAAKALAPATQIETAPDEEDIGDDDYSDENFADDYASDPYDFDEEDDVDQVEGAGETEIKLGQGGPDEGLYDPVREDEIDETAIVADADISTPSQDAASVIAPEVSTPPQDTAPDTATDTSNKAAVLSAKIAALETAIGKISDTWEPDDIGESDYAGTAAQEMTWEDDPEPAPTQRPVLAPVLRRVSDPVDAKDTTSEKPEVEVAAEDATQPAQAFTSQRSVKQQKAEVKVEPETPEEPQLTVEETVGPQPTLDTKSAQPETSDDDQLLDEDALRDLVSEIVRAELQGALGERITRNVRKLVRREIHRALTVQELE